MNSRSKRAVAIIASSAAIVGLAGCTAAEEGTGDVENKTLTIGMNSGLVAQFETYAEEFMSINEGWDISVSPVPDAQPEYIQQLVTQGLSSSTPDIIFNYDTLNPTLANNELLLDLTPYLQSGDTVTEDGFVPAFLDQYRVGDAITGLPVSADSGMLFYNADLFAEYGAGVC